MINLDRAEFNISCPRCRFENSVFYRQARLRDVVICRGCKATIRLDDHMNECLKVRQKINQTFSDLERALKGLNKTLNIRL